VITYECRRFPITAGKISDALDPIAVSSSGSQEYYGNIFSEINSLPKILLTVRPDHADLKIDKNRTGDCKLKISNIVNNIIFPLIIISRLA
jgi:hypothetical protein